MKDKVLAIEMGRQHTIAVQVYFYAEIFLVHYPLVCTNGVEKHWTSDFMIKSDFLSCLL